MNINYYLSTIAIFGALWLFVTIFGCAIFSAVVASTKNRCTLSWFLAGLIFNIVALIAIAGIPVLKKDTPE